MSYVSKDSSFFMEAMFKVKYCSHIPGKLTSY